MFKPFYVHRFYAPCKLTNRHPRGFTAMVSPVKDDHSVVQLQATFCSPKDQFCRKTGRRVAAEATAEIIKKKDLPRWLAALSLVCQFTDESDVRNWFYTYKYIV